MLPLSRSCLPFLTLCAALLTHLTQAIPQPTLPNLRSSNTPYYVSRNPDVAAVREPGDASSIFLIYGLPSEVPILGQAVGGILVQSMVQAYREFGSAPDSLRSNFQHVEYSSGAFCPSFDVELSLTAQAINGSAVAAQGSGHSPADIEALYALTNKRIVTVMELLGFDFSHEQDLNTLTESTFEIFVSYDKEGTRKIAEGFIANAKEGQDARTQGSCRTSPPKGAGFDQNGAPVRGD